MTKILPLLIIAALLLFNPSAMSTPSNMIVIDNRSRGLKNNNPLNIKFSVHNAWLGKIPYANNTDKGKVFEQFREMEYGIRAALKLIQNYIKSGVNTIPTIVQKWAPAGVDNNHTKNYTEYVINKTGLTFMSVIKATDKETLINICHAMTTFENGHAIDKGLITSAYEKYIQKPV